MRRFDVVEVDRENMCIISLASGVINDHLPNNVLSALTSVKKRRQQERARPQYHPLILESMELQPTRLDGGGTFLGDKQTMSTPEKGYGSRIGH